ncbi:uncharacterized protein LOC122261616 isoform X2 [Penaeus japonicus]|nr:uncharacterized protein LOC122261616 isoform X2 [Penaeus japonicus]XP_042885286.1 uncharacterized protein LOC122261616 isoform X2 [Penaeus japonicus]
MSFLYAPFLAFLIVHLKSPVTQCAVFRISKGEWKSSSSLNARANGGNMTVLDRKLKQEPRQISSENKPLVIAISTVAGVILLCIIVFLLWYLYKWRKVKQVEKQTLDRNSTVTYHRYNSSIEHLPDTSESKRSDRDIISAYGPSGYRYNPPQRFKKYTPRERQPSPRPRTPSRVSHRRRNSDPFMTWSRAKSLGLPESRWQANGQRPLRGSIMSDFGPAPNQPRRQYALQGAPLWYDKVSRPPDYYAREVIARSRRPSPSLYSDYPPRASRRSAPPYGRYYEY